MNKSPEQSANSGGWQLVAEATLGAPATDTRQHGFVSTAPLQLGALQSILPQDPVAARQTGHLHHAGIASLREAGWEVWRAAENPNLLHISRKSGAPCTVEFGEDSSAVRAIGGAILLDRSQLGGACRLRAEDGAGGHAALLLESNGDGATSLQCFRQVAAIPFALPVVESPVTRWALGDPWLTAVVQKKLRSGDPVDHIAAVGHTLRLGIDEPPLAGDPAARLAQVPPQITWAMTMPPAKAAAIAAIVRVRAERLREDLARLLDSDDLPPKGFAGALTVYLRSRDDLESARLILDATAARGQCDLALADLDDLAAPACRHLDTDCVVPDPQLERAASVQADAWWARVGEDADENDDAADEG